jgi:hypothetical protein
MELLCRMITIFGTGEWVRVCNPQLHESCSIASCPDGPHRLARSLSMSYEGLMASSRLRTTEPNRLHGHPYACNEVGSLGNSLARKPIHRVPSVDGSSVRAGSGISCDVLSRLTAYQPPGVPEPPGRGSLGGWSIAFFLTSNDLSRSQPTSDQCGHQSKTR